MKTNISMTTRLESTQKGFTLIELMITLLLGALISAAVIQVFLTSQRVDRLQTSASEVQDKSIFGMQSIEQQIRLANLGSFGKEFNDTTLHGGVVLSATTTAIHRADPSITANVISDDLLKDGYLTRGGTLSTAGNDGWTGVNNMSSSSAKSDQLTIQYANVASDVEMFDCEGVQILADERVIERYYLKKEADKSINLRCDAGRIIATKVVASNSYKPAKNEYTYSIANFGETSGNQSAIIMEDVDQFNIRLGVARNTVVSGRKIIEQGDMTVKDYMSLTGNKPVVTNVRMAVLARSDSNSPDGSLDIFNIFGTVQSLNAATIASSQKYMRRLYETNITLRNSSVKLDIQ